MLAGPFIFLVFPPSPPQKKNTAGGRCAKIAWHPVLRRGAPGPFYRHTLQTPRFDLGWGHVSSYTGRPWRWNSPSYGFVLKTAVMFFKYWKALIVWTCRLGVPTAGQVEAENTYILNSPLQKGILHLNSSMIFRFEPLIVNLPGSCWGSLLCCEGHVFFKEKFSSEEDLKKCKEVWNR